MKMQADAVPEREEMAEEMVEYSPVVEVPGLVSLVGWAEGGMRDLV